MNNHELTNKLKSMHLGRCDDIDLFIYSCLHYSEGKIRVLEVVDDSYTPIFFHRDRVLELCLSENCICVIYNGDADKHVDRVYVDGGCNG